MDKEVQKLVQHDTFTETVGQSVEYVQSHRSQLVKYAGIAAGVAAVIAGVWWMRSSQHATRQADLAAALRNKDAVIGPGTPGDPRPAYPNKEAKEKASLDGYQSVISKYGGTDEAAVAYYELAAIAADAGKMDEAAKHYRSAVAAGGREIGSTAKLSLAQVLLAQNKNSEAEALLKELIASPTLLVSKEQASFALARALALAKPEEARKILDPFRKDARQAVARNAEILIGELLPTSDKK